MPSKNIVFEYLLLRTYYFCSTSFKETHVISQMTTFISINMLEHTFYHATDFMFPKTPMITSTSL